MPVTFVRIPCDSSAPLEELTLEDPAGGKKAGEDLLRAHLVPKFKQGSVDPGAVKKQLGDYSAQLDMSMLEQGAVETFPLTRPTDVNRQVGVTLYLDECGVLKNLPRNERATALAEQAGHTTPFHGDIYVSREQHGPDGRQLADFTLADMSSDAPWLLSAPAQNYEHAVATKKLHDSMGDGFQHIKLNEGMDGTDLTSGGGEGYTWTQTSEEVEVVIPVAAGVKAREVHVKYGVGSLLARVGGSDPVLDAQLEGRIRPDESSWSISGDGDSRTLQITLEKQTPGPWKSLLAGSS